ncbi:hypothetical protein P691DRAFT_218319 [Macrolepiota fuliginosa MF-IS2]|uniref:Uncharacterized protein n=1 Tax=Macrolepiota fuliginosa MF-IS2 TaxID=1400762 RepID=A0A9P5WWB2_9AGAR|nr:hypothetical protein P691DRAFT_218319 [Macrolepiota fuliginosa MF-IS2]
MQDLVQEMSPGVRNCQQHSSMDALRKVKSPHESRFLAELQKAVDASLFWDLTNNQEIRLSDPQGVQSRCLDMLDQVDATQLYTFYIPNYFSDDFWDWLKQSWRVSQEQLKNRGLVKEAVLGDLTLDYLNCGLSYPSCLKRMGGIDTELLMPHSSDELDQYILGLKSLQQEQPHLMVLICGSTPEKRGAFFHHEQADVLDHCH